MVSTIWNKLIDCKDDIITIFEENATEIQEDGLDYFNRPDSGWINRVWANDNVRRAHIDCLLYTSPSPRDNRVSRMPSSA